MKTRHFMMLAIVTGLAAVMAVSGCEKQEPAVPHEHDHDHEAMTEPMEGAAAEATDTEQTLCPVMNMPINKDIFTEYKGKKVYFCCPECKPKFEKDPEKYISKLPQFQADPESE